MRGGQLTNLCLAQIRTTTASFAFHLHLLFLLVQVWVHISFTAGMLYAVWKVLEVHRHCQDVDTELFTDGSHLGM